jgi:hypothetical protein
VLLRSQFIRRHPAVAAVLSDTKEKKRQWWCAKALKLKDSEELTSPDKKQHTQKKTLLLLIFNICLLVFCFLLPLPLLYSACFQPGFFFFFFSTRVSLLCFAAFSLRVCV